MIGVSKSKLLSVLLKLENCVYKIACNVLGFAIGWGIELRQPVTEAD
jgi:hypothetical protein